MATNKRIQELTAAAALAGTDLALIGQGTKAFQVPLSTLFNTAPVTATGSTTGRSLASRFSDIINIKDFGAVGDFNGTTGTDNTLLIQAAIDEAELNGVLAVFVPVGDYLISAPLVISTSEFLFFGEGVQSRITQNDDEDIIQLDSSGGILDFLTLRDFSLHVRDAVTPTVAVGIHVLVSAITAYGVRRSTFEDIDFFNMAEGIKIDKGKLEANGGFDQLDPNKFNNFRNLRMHPGNGDKVYGIRWVGGANGGNTIVGCQLRGTTAGIKIGDGATNTSVGDLLITGNKINGGSSSANGRAIDIAGPTGAGRYNQKVGIIANDFDGFLTEAVRMTDMSNSRIIGCSGLDSGYTLSPHNQFVLENNGVSFLEMRSATAVTVNNSTTLVDITTLAFAIQNLEEAHFSLSLRFSSATAADVKIGFNFPAGCSIRWSPTSAGYWNSSGTWTSSNELTETGTLIVQGIAVATRQWLHLDGYVVNGATAGTITPQFAQGTADVSDTKINAFSTLRVWRERNNI